jgi:hypothetical protein
MRTSELLSDIRRAIGAPTYQARYSDNDILKIASSQQKSVVVPEIRKLRKNHFLKNEDFSVLSGATELALPERAIGRTVYKVWMTSATIPVVSDFRELKYLEVGEILSTRTSNGDTYGYYFEDDKLKFHPALAEDSTVRLYYLFRPGELVLESRTATISGVGTDTLTLDATPSNITLNSKIDVVKVNAGFETLCKDLVVSARSSTSVTVTGYDFSTMGISVGDILSLKRETSVVQLPEDCHDVLVWATASDIAIGLGVDSIIAHTEKAYLGVLMGMRDALSPRSEDPQTIINPRSLLRSGGTRLGSILR